MWGLTNRNDKDQAQEPHQDIQDKGKDESFNPISHEDYHPIWLEDGIFSGGRLEASKRNLNFQGTTWHQF